MLIYHPPKSQVWGHRLGRLKTMQLFDRSERFVQEQMLVQPSQIADLQTIKDYLKKIELVVLSDKHLRPARTKA